MTLDHNKSCDLCGKEYRERHGTVNEFCPNAQHEYIYFEHIMNTNITINMGRKELYFDLCPSCAEKIFLAIGKRPKSDYRCANCENFNECKEKYGENFSEKIIDGEKVNLKEKPEWVYNCWEFKFDEQEKKEATDGANDTEN